MSQAEMIMLRIPRSTLTALEAMHKDANKVRELTPQEAMEIANIALYRPAELKAKIREFKEEDIPLPEIIRDIMTDGIASYDKGCRIVLKEPSVSYVLRVGDDLRAAIVGRHDAQNNLAKELNLKLGMNATEYSEYLAIGKRTLLATDEHARFAEGCKLRNGQTTMGATARQLLLLGITKYIPKDYEKLIERPIEVKKSSHPLTSWDK